jgi:hypothetical protein
MAAAQVEICRRSAAAMAAISRKIGALPWLGRIVSGLAFALLGQSRDPGRQPKQGVSDLGSIRRRRHVVIAFSLVAQLSNRPTRKWSVGCLHCINPIADA